MALQVLRNFNPFKAYMCVGSWAFGGTIVANFAGSAIDRQAPISFMKDPQQFTIMAVSKGLYFGAFWPCIPMNIYNDTRGYFVLGAGLEKGWDLHI